MPETKHSMSTQPDTRAPFALQTNRLFDAARFVDEPVVLVEAGAVVAVGSDVPRSVAAHDLGAATLLPGFVDCHQHLVFDGNGTLEEQVTGRTDEPRSGRGRDQPPGQLFLAESPLCATSVTATSSRSICGMTRTCPRSCVQGRQSPWSTVTAGISEVSVVTVTI